MRDPKRIDAVIEAVKEEWKQVPDWRLGQLITNISRAAGMEDPFYLEDDQLLGVIRGGNAGGAGGAEDAVQI